MGLAISRRLAKLMEGSLTVESKGGSGSVFTLEHIRNNEILKDLYVISLTANAMEGAREKFLTLGMDDYLSKPINEEKLYRVIYRFLA